MREKYSPMMSEELLDFFPHFVLVFDRFGCIVNANRPALEYLGRSVDDLIDQGPNDPFHLKTHLEDLAIAFEEQRCCREEDGPFESERRLLWEDGGYRWFLFRYKPTRDDKERGWRWICTATDIEELKRDDEHHRQVLDATPAFLHTAFPDGTVEYLNKRWIEYLGAPLQTILNQTPIPVSTSTPGISTTMPNLAATIYPEDLPEFAKVWPAIVASAKPGQFEIRVRRFDGQFRWFLFQAAPVQDRNSKIAKWYVASFDIDERKRAQEELRKRDIDAAAQYRVALDTLPGLGWTARPDGAADFLSRGWLEYAGLSMAEALGWGFMVSIHPDDVAHGMAAYEAALHSGAMFETEVRVRRHDGVYRWFLFRGNALRNEAGDIVNWFGTNTDIEDRKRVEDALKESEQSLRTIVETIPGLVHTTNTFGDVLTVSQQELDYFGMKLEELKDWQQIVHPDDAEQMVEDWRKRLDSGENYDREIRLRRADGKYRWIHAKGVPLRNELNQIIRWYFLMTDIDERKKAEEVVRRNERYLMEGQRLSRTGSFSWDAITKVPRYLSEECLRIFDFETIPTWQECVNVIDPEDRERWTETIDRAIRDEAPYELKYRILTRKGTRKHVRVVAHPVSDTSGKLAEFVGTVIDITDQHKAEESMRESERHLRLLIETIPAHVWSTGPDGTCIYVNRQHLSYSGCSSEELLAMNWLGAIHPDDIEVTREAWSRCVQTGERYERTQRIRRYDGIYRWFHTIAEPLLDKDHKVTRWYGLNIDIDDSRNLAETLRTTQARLFRATEIATVAELSASIAHEINQPLGAVVANGDACELWLSTDPPNIERAQAAVHRIIRDGKAAAEVILRIRALFKQVVPNKLMLNINNLLSEATDLLATDIRRKGVLLDTRFTVALPNIFADRVQMQQLFVNLLHNAIESMERVEGRPRTLRIQSGLDEEKYIVIEISDSGSGLESTERIFDAFFTTKEKGMGMGLAICRSIVDGHDGKLNATPNIPHGTTFTVHLPIAASNTN